MRLTFVVVVVAAVSAACPGRDAFPDVKPPSITLPTLPKIDVSSLPLPKAPDGKAILIEASNARLEIDPTAQDAITAVGACTDLVAYCVGPGRSLDACVGATPSCLTDRPWTEPEPCCPSTCKRAFADDVARGVQPLHAFTDVFFDAPTCFPGVSAALEGR